MVERPQYANAVTVAYNEVLGEVVLNFALDYPKPQNTAGSNGQPVQMEVERESVCGVVLTKEIARQLIGLLGQSISGEANE